MSLWDTNWATSHGVGKETRKAFNQLRSAYVERCAGAGRTVHALLASDIPTNGRVRRIHRAALHNEVTALISAYVNHTDHGGNWNGQTTIPAWTEATILTAIGDASKLPIPNDHINCASWNWQTKRILDLLRWGKQSVSFERSEYNYKTNGNWSGSSWSAAVSNFNGESWQILEAGYNGHYAQNSGALHGYQIWRNRLEKTFSNSTGMDYTIDSYCIFNPWSGNGFFEYNDYAGSISGKLFKTESQLITNGSSQKLTIGDFSNCSITTQPNPHTEDLNVVGYFFGAQYQVKKFDGPNGFGFLDN